MNLDFSVMTEYFGYLANATTITLKVTLYALFFGFVLAVPLAFMKLSRFRLLRWVTSF